MKQYASRSEVEREILPPYPRHAALDHLLRKTRDKAVGCLLRIPVEAQPLLALQRYAFSGTSATCVCEDFRTAQRYFLEYTVGTDALAVRPYLVHEMMPAHQQDYVLECLSAMKNSIIPVAITLITTRQFYLRLMTRLPWLMETEETVYAASGATHEMPALAASDVAVSCICLRAGSGGHWLLMDHEDAATVQPAAQPPECLVPRLLRHSVNIPGDRLAPYQAMVFDVPLAWKSNPDIATRSLLIFKEDVFDLGCRHPGMPSHITWNDTLGILF